MAGAAIRAVDAWLVPIDPVPPAPFDRLLRIKYRADYRHPALVLAAPRSGSFAARMSSTSSQRPTRSFLLAPLPAVIVAKLLGKPVILNYHSGEAPDHLRRSAVARFVMRHVVDANVVPSTFLRDVLASFDIDAEVVPNTIDLAAVRLSRRATHCARGCSARATSNRSTTCPACCVPSPESRRAIPTQR